MKKFIDRVNLLIEAKSTAELRLFKSLHFERLTGDKKGFYSIRINKAYRLEFTVEGGTVKIEEIITIYDLTNHYKK